MDDADVSRTLTGRVLLALCSLYFCLCIYFHSAAVLSLFLSLHFCTFNIWPISLMTTAVAAADAAAVAPSNAYNFQAYLGMPNYPVPVNAPWDVDPSLMPAYNEWTRRLFVDYTSRYGHMKSFAGVYQPMELCMCGDSMLQHVLDAYNQTATLVREGLPGAHRAFYLS